MQPVEGPTTSGYRVIRAVLCALLKVDSNALTLSAIASHPVDLLPLQADGSRGGARAREIRAKFLCNGTEKNTAGGNFEK